MNIMGNVVVNWFDENNELIELEFLKNGINYFVEKTGTEHYLQNTEFKNFVNEIGLV